MLQKQSTPCNSAGGICSLLLLQLFLQLLLSLWPRTRYTFRCESVCHLCHTFVVAVVVVNVADVAHVAIAVALAAAAAVLVAIVVPVSFCCLPNWMRRDSRCQAVS